MGENMRKSFSIFAPLLMFAVVILLPSQGFGESSRITINSMVPQKLNLAVGKSLIINDPGPGNIAFASAAPSIVEVMRLPTGQIYLRGIAPGITNISILEQKKVTAIFDIEVTPDISRLQESLRRILPQEGDIKVSADNDRITLSGSVSNPGSLGQVMALANAYAPEKVTNLLYVHSVPRTNLLKEKLHELLPDEEDIRITQAGDKITLTGTVSSATGLAQVLDLAAIYAGGGDKVMNLLEVGGVQQVMLEVRVAEMSRGLTRRLGINFSYLSKSGQNAGVSALGNLATNLSIPAADASTSTSSARVTSSSSLTENANTSSKITGSAETTETTSGSGTDKISETVSEIVRTSATGGAISGNVASVVNAVFRFFGYDTSWLVFIDALKDSGLVKILAEPTLITTSGQNAEFLAGGEFPIPVPQEQGVITIEYKRFGVGLAFTPTVLSNDKISLRVSPEVSEIDFSTAVAAGGVAVPGLTSRRLSTTIELADGQSFAIGGLLQSDVRELVTKFPVLGDIPVLGSLFRSTNFLKNETELIIIATVHLVKPLDMAQQTLPTDQFVEPDDFEFYMLGRLEGAKEESLPALRSGATPATGGMEGDFGHILPK